MKKYTSVIALFALFLLIIPSIAIFADSNSSILNNKTKFKVEKVEIVKILDENSGEVLNVPINDYTVGAVLAQMPSSFELEALKAQAVLCNTYAIRRRQEEKYKRTEELDGADFSTDNSKYLAYFTDDQVKELYGDKYQENKDKVKKAVDEVSGKVLVYESEPIVVAFHSISAGKTDSAMNIWGVDIPYLVSANVSSDENVEAFEQKLKFTQDELKARLEQSVDGITLGSDMDMWIEVAEKTNSGYVKSVKIGDEKVILEGEKLAAILNLKSSAFEIEIDGESLEFTTKGYGHGVGMSQYGANAMAKDNTYDMILKYFFNGTNIVTVK